MGMALSILFACGKIEKQEYVSEPINGGDANPGGPTIPQAKLVQDVAQRPACVAENDGQLIYAKKEAVLAACISGAWNAININNGSGISEAIYCQMMVPQQSLLEAGLDKAPVSGMHFFYGVTQFSNATRNVQVRVSTGAESLTSSADWHPDQEGYGKMMSQELVLDMMGDDDFGLWFFTADAELTGDVNNPFAIAYSDPGVEGSKLLVFDSEKDCQGFKPGAAQ